MRTESPLHFSAKNMAPSFMNAMSYGESILSTTSSVVAVGAAAHTLPDRARPMDAAKAWRMMWFMSESPVSLVGWPMAALTSHTTAGDAPCRRCARCSDPRNATIKFTVAIQHV
jgi:hypothetical protein